MKRLRFVGIWLAMLAFLFLPSSVSADSTSGSDVYVVEVKNTIETGLAQSLERAFTEAEQIKPKAILLRIDTLGGSISAAIDIGQRIRQSSIPVIAYVEQDAVSAGAYIALNAKHLAMAPGSTIGAAEPRTVDGQTADPKVLSVWKAEMRSAAEATGRDGRIAEGMVDINLDIPNVKKPGTLLSLSAEQAVQLGIADGIFKNQEEVLQYYGYPSASLAEYQMSFAERLARILTNPFVIPVLLIIGVVGLVVEMLIPGVTLPGVIGLVAFGLFFFGNMIAGFAGWESLVLFVLGVVLLVIEIFVTGFGLIGLAGIIAIGASVGVAVYDAKYGVQSFLLALVFAGIAAWVTVKYFGQRGAWNKLILKDQFTKEEGYVPAKSYNYLLFQEGVALTPLRPAGTVVINEQRFDVVTEGGFVNPGETIEVMHVEGTRIVVRRKS